MSRQSKGLFGRNPERNDNNEARRSASTRARFSGLEAYMDKVDCVVIGAGVIGLAVARRLAQAGREVIVLEAAEGIGTETSSRNSEVIHAGIYYRAGSLMAQMCVAGKHALYRYCREHGIPHRNCGKLIVATTPRKPKNCNRSGPMPRPMASTTCSCSTAKPRARWSRR